MRVLEDLRHSIIDLLRKKSSQALRLRPAALPSLEPLSSDASLSKLLTELYPRVERVLLVVEADDSYVGREIILDLSGSSRASAWRVRSKPTDGNLFTELCSEYYLCNNEEWTTNLATVYELVREKHSARHFLR